MPSDKPETEGRHWPQPYDRMTPLRHRLVQAFVPHPGPFDALSPCQRTVLRVKIHLAKHRAAVRAQPEQWLRIAQSILEAIERDLSPELRARIMRGHPETAQLAAIWLWAERTVRTMRDVIEQLDRTDQARQRRKADLERKVTFAVKRRMVTDEVFELAWAELESSGRSCGRRALSEAAWWIAKRLGYSEKELQMVTADAAREYKSRRLRNLDGPERA